MSADNRRIHSRIGLATVRDSRLLVVRPRGQRHYILPGGKPTQGERPGQALSREIREELDTELLPGSLTYIGRFSDSAAEADMGLIDLELYGGELASEPHAASEIEELAWVDGSAGQEMLAPLLRNKVIPFLRSAGRL